MSHMSRSHGVSLLFRSAFPQAWTAILNLPFGAHSGSSIENLNDGPANYRASLKGRRAPATEHSISRQPTKTPNQDRSYGAKAANQTTLPYLSWLIGALRWFWCTGVHLINRQARNHHQK